MNDKFNDDDEDDGNTFRSNKDEYEQTNDTAVHIGALSALIKDLEDTTEMKEILSTLEQDSSMDKIIEQLLYDFHNTTMDESQVQFKVIRLLTEYLNKISQSKNLKTNQKKLSKEVTDLSYHITNKLVKNSELRLGNNQKSHNYLTPEAKHDMRRLIKNFMIYEIYKVMNPRRIAGETRKVNFVHNMIVGGLDRATKYAGGTKAELAKYSPKLIKDLQQKHQKFKGKGGSLGI